MGRVNTPLLAPDDLARLETLFKKSLNHTLRQRCQVVLLKAAGRTSDDVGAVVGLCHVSVNSWVKRYNTEGIRGLETKPGRGRKPLLTLEKDGEAVLAAVQANRQHIALAKADWEAQRSEEEAVTRPVSRDTFRSFLKGLAADTPASGGG